MYSIAFIVKTDIFFVSSKDPRSKGGPSSLIILAAIISQKAAALSAREQKHFGAEGGGMEVSGQKVSYSGVRL